MVRNNILAVFFLSIYTIETVVPLGDGAADLSQNAGYSNGAFSLILGNSGQKITVTAIDASRINIAVDNENDGVSDFSFDSTWDSFSQAIV